MININKTFKILSVKYPGKLNFFFLGVALVLFVSSSTCLAEHVQTNQQNPAREAEPNITDYSFEFKVTPKLQRQVEFWTKVYSKYSSDQVIIHDKEHLNVIYTVLDFSYLKNSRGSYRSKRKKRQRVVKKAKEKYRLILKKLAHKRAKISQLNQEERRIYNLFVPIYEKNKFYRASSWRRIRAQKGQKDSFQKAIIRSGLYIDKMEEIFQSAGLPIELTRLPFVESFFNPYAQSKCSASGMWQFMYATGRLFLKINHLVDERRDPFISTEAAAKLLKNNFDKLGSWPLALTAYNHGALGVARGLKRTQAETLEELIENYNHRRFGFASKNFYAEFLAALDVSTHYRKYFGELPLEKALAFDTVELPYYTNSKDLFKYCGITKEDLKVLNPALRLTVRRGENLIPKGYSLRIPKDTEEKFLVAYKQIPQERKYLAQNRNLKHRVRRGETLSVIARRYRTRIDSILAANSIRNPNLVRVGQYLRIPTRQISTAAISGNGTIKHRVRRGETLSKIARNYSCNISQISQLNNLRNRHILSVGQVLTIPQSQSFTYQTEKKNKKTDASEKEIEPSSTPQEEIVEAIQEENEEPAENKDFLPEGDNDNSSPIQEVTVYPHETLGHYADWVRVSTHSLRSLNNLRYQQNIHVGQKLLVDFSQVTRAEFDEKRKTFHDDLEKQYLSQYKIERVLTHKLKPRQNVWYLCRYVYKVPLWLVKRYNANKNLAELHVGDEVLIPILKEM